MAHQIRPVPERHKNMSVYDKELKKKHNADYYLHNNQSTYII